MAKSKIRLAVGFAATLACAVGGCDTSDQQADRTPPPGQPATVDPPTALPPASSTQPAATQPVGESYLWLKEVPDPRRKAEADVAPPADPDEIGKPVKFPRARLKLTGKGDHALVALLYSDDPKEAIKADWQGDRYYFRMPLQVADRAAIDGLPYRMAVSLEEAEETTTGVFLVGDRYHLEPIDLSVKFEVQGPHVRVFIGGLFKQIDGSNALAEPRWFHVQGIVQAAVE